MRATMRWLSLRGASFDGWRMGDSPWTGQRRSGAAGRVSYSAALAICGKRGMATEAWKLLESMKGADVHPDARTYGHLLAAQAAAADGEGARRAWQEAENELTPEELRECVSVALRNAKRCGDTLGDAKGAAATSAIVDAVNAGVVSDPEVRAAVREAEMSLMIE
eukprot:Hpha_TRINITY_DN14738_c0_g2::TRINITY_DN14738_c0_g2_i1::g.102664::m.102664